MGAGWWWELRSKAAETAGLKSWESEKSRTF
jgi:hypothetical protein